MHMTSRQRARAYPQPGKLVIGVMLDLLCKGLAIGAVIALTTFLFRSPSLTDWSQGDPLWAELALAGLVLYPVVAVCRYQHGRRTLCSLCHGPVFNAQSSVKSRHGTKIAGLDYRTSVVLALFFVGRYRCMHCGTPFRLRR
jgi:hypothetical protein